MKNVLLFMIVYFWKGIIHSDKRVFKTAETRMSLFVVVSGLVDFRDKTIKRLITY